MAKSKKGKAVIAGVAAVSAASILTVRGIFHKVFARQEKEDDAISLRYKDMSGMVRKKITIVSGSTHLTGYLYGEASAKGLVVVCHGIAGGGEDNLSMVIRFLHLIIRVCMKVRELHLWASIRL